MRCPQCNAKLEKNMHYCPVCGENLIIYRQSQNKTNMEGEAYSYYNKEERKKIDDQVEGEMVAPLSPDKRKQKIKMITVAVIALLAGFGAFYLLDYLNIAPRKQITTGSTIATATPQFEHIRSEYYEQSLVLLNECTSVEVHDRAIAIGGEAFLTEMNVYSEQLDRYYQQAQSSEEKQLASIIENISLYSLSNDGERAFVEELGGRSDEAQNAALQERQTWISHIIEQLKQASTQEELNTIEQEIEQKLNSPSQ